MLRYVFNLGYNLLLLQSCKLLIYLARQSLQRNLSTRAAGLFPFAGDSPCICGLIPKQDGVESKYISMTFTNLSNIFCEITTKEAEKWMLTTRKDLCFQSTCSDTYMLFRKTSW